MKRVMRKQCLTFESRSLFSMEPSLVWPVLCVFVATPHFSRQLHAKPVELRRFSWYLVIGKYYCALVVVLRFGPIHGSS